MPRRPLLCFLAFVAPCTPLSGVAQAQAVPLQWSVSVPNAPIQSGKPFLAVVHAIIPFGWHLYSMTQPAGGPMATIITSTETSARVSGTIKARAPDLNQVKYATTIVNETYDESVSFVVPMVAGAKGTRVLEIEVRYQACTNRYCAFPRADTVRARLRIEGELPR